MESKVIIGIDVSKSRLDYLPIAPLSKWSEVQSKPVSQIANESEAIETLLSRFSVSKSYFVFEPTGTYSDKLLQLLSQKGYRFSIVNPRKANLFCRTMQISDVNDQQAARLLAYMGDRLELPLYQPPAPAMLKRKQLLAALDGLNKMAQMLANQLHAQQQYLQPHPAVLEAIEAQQACLQQQILQLETQLSQIEDPQFEQQKKLAMTVLGIGPVTAQKLMILTQGLENFHSPGQLINYCGLVGKKHQSGSSVFFKRGVSKNSPASLRAALFMGARSAIRFNLACKDLYQRLRAKGKPYFVAIVAVMAKLLKQVFGVIKSGIEFDNQFYLKFQKN